MKKILRVSHPNIYAEFVNAPVLHPQISIIHYDELAPFRHSLNHYGVYGLFVLHRFCKDLSYGNVTVQEAEDSILAVAPGQMGGVEDNGELFNLNGWCILWSQELTSALDITARKYPFFNYFFTTPLLLETEELEAISRLLLLMRSELELNEDSVSLRRITVSYLLVILEYCNRAYYRQIQSEKLQTPDLLQRFQRLLDQYYERGLQYSNGAPNVTFCARELAFSPAYFGSMVHKMTGSTAIEYIHTYLVDQAKVLLMKGHNVNETAHMLGFNYPHHFIRLFKKLTGVTPSEYR